MGEVNAVIGSPKEFSKNKAKVISIKP